MFDKVVLEPQESIKSKTISEMIRCERGNGCWGEKIDIIVDRHSNLLPYHHCRFEQKQRKNSNLPISKGNQNENDKSGRKKTQWLNNRQKILIKCLPEINNNSTGNMNNCKVKTEKFWFNERKKTWKKNVYYKSLNK